MERSISPYIIDDLDKKIVLLTGPRQCGKTTLSKRLFSEYDYLNFDAAPDRIQLQAQSWDRATQLIVFDELHKKPQWKRWIKGVYDTEGVRPRLLVTGSARLDIHRKAGDSLAGRYFQFRLHPFDLKEVLNYSELDKETAFEMLWQYSGFPEPFLKNSLTYYRRWQQSHTDSILRVDLLDLNTISDIQAIETLVELLRQRVGQTVSYANLARDIEKDPKTVKRWLQLLENLYVIFRVTPYSKKIARSLLKDPKYYFYDFARIEEKGARLENMVACALLKECHFIEDTQGQKTKLHFLRTKDGKEVDFLVCLANKPLQMIEVKWADDEPATALMHFKKMLPDVNMLQIVKELHREKTFPSGVAIRSAINFLAKLPVFP